MIIIYPNGYIQEKLHDEDLKKNPDRHFITKDKYSREESLEMCLDCMRKIKAYKIFKYDAFTDSFNKIYNDNG